LAGNRCTGKVEPVRPPEVDKPYLKKGSDMNKTELVKRVAEKLDDLPKKTAAKAVDAVFQSIQEGLEKTAS
jgi:uncharacterized protein (DUF2267 family)